MQKQINNIIGRAGSSLFFPAHVKPGQLIFRAQRALGNQIYQFKPNLSLKCYIFFEWKTNLAELNWIYGGGVVT